MQQVSDRPGEVTATDTEAFGVGALFLAAAAVVALRSWALMLTVAASRNERPIVAAWSLLGDNRSVSQSRSKLQAVQADKRVKLNQITRLAWPLRAQCRAVTARVLPLRRQGI